MGKGSPEPDLTSSLLADALAACPPKGPQCRLFAIVGEKLEGEFAEAWEAIERGKVTRKAVADELSKRLGKRISANTVTRHATGQCSCTQRRDQS